MEWKEAKQKIAENENFEDWKDLQRQCDMQFEIDCLEDAGKLMENRIKELEEKINSVLAMSSDYGRSGCKYGDTEYDSLSAVYGYNQALSEIKSKLE